MKKVYLDPPSPAGDLYSTTLLEQQTRAKLQAAGTSCGNLQDESAAWKVSRDHQLVLRINHGRAGPLGQSGARISYVRHQDTLEGNQDKAAAFTLV